MAPYILKHESPTAKDRRVARVLLQLSIQFWEQGRKLDAGGVLAFVPAVWILVLAPWYLPFPFPLSETESLGLLSTI
jgi:hypothetical protein